MSIIKGMLKNIVLSKKSIILDSVNHTILNFNNLKNIKT